MANEFVVRRGIKSLGGITFPQVTINSTYSVTDDDYMVDITGGTFTVSLPTAVGRQGRLFVIKNNGGGAVTVDPYGSETIDGKPFVILGETNSIQLASNGSEWVAMSYNISTVNSSTGVFEFTGMTIASPTTFTVAPVKAWIVDDSTNPLSPQLYYVDYSGGTHTAIYVTASTSSYIYLNSGGTISQQSIPLTEQQRRQNIFLGKLGHANKTNIINAFSQPDFVLSPLSQLRDMFTPIPLINGGIYASPNGANLSFNTSAGYLYGLGINFANDTLSPDAIYVTGTDPATFQYRTQTGGTASDVTLIDPTKYDVGGVITSLSGTKATNQRIFLVQNGKFRVQYGQTQYSNLSQAIAGIATETFTTFSNFRDNGILIGVLSVLSTATNLTDTSKAQFFYTSKFGETVGSAGGFSTTNLQQAYNNSIDPEIITNSTLGALTLQRGSASDSDNVFEVQDGAGVHRMWVSGSGRTTTTDLTITGVTSTSGLTRYLVVDTSGNTYHQTGGDMILGSTQTNSGAKTFLDTTFLLRNVANTFNGSFTNTNTADRIYTLPNATGTIALTSDLSDYVTYSGLSSQLYRIVNTVDSATTTANTLTLIYSRLIPANTFATGDVIRISYRGLKVGSVSGSNAYHYVHTASTVSSATLLATFATSQNIRMIQMDRKLYIKNVTGNTEMYNTTVSSSGEYTLTATSTFTNIAINWTINQYIIFANTLNSTSDSFKGVSYEIERIRQT